MRLLVVGVLLIVILPGDSAVIDEHFVTVYGDEREVFIGLRIFQRRLGLRQLLLGLRHLSARLRYLGIEIGRVDIG